MKVYTFTCSGINNIKIEYSRRDKEALEKIREVLISCKFTCSEITSKEI